MPQWRRPAARAPSGPPGILSRRDPIRVVCAGHPQPVERNVVGTSGGPCRKGDAQGPCFPTSFDMVGVTGSIPVAPPRIHVFCRHVETRRKCPLTAGFSNASFESLVLRKAHGRFRAAVSAAKNPVPGAEKVW